MSLGQVKEQERIITKEEKVETNEDLKEFMKEISAITEQSNKGVGNEGIYYTGAKE